MKKIRSKFVICMLLLVVLGLGCLVVSLLIKDKHPFRGNILDDLSSALFISGLFGMFNEFVMKDDHLNLIIDKVRLKKSIEDTGIVDFHLGWQAVPYQELFSGTRKNLDVVNAYGDTWLKIHRDRIVNIIKNSSVKLRVILLDPDDDHMMDVFSRHYGISKEELVIKINNVTKRWKTIYNESGIDDESRLKIFYHRGIQTIALYRFDDYMISNELVITSNFSTGSKFPCIICKKSLHSEGLFDIYLKQIDDLVTESREIPLNEIEREL